MKFLKKYVYKIDVFGILMAIYRYSVFAMFTLSILSNEYVIYFFHRDHLDPQVLLVPLDLTVKRVLQVNLAYLDQLDQMDYRLVSCAQ